MFSSRATFCDQLSCTRFTEQKYVVNVELAKSLVLVIRYFPPEMKIFPKIEMLKGLTDIIAFLFMFVFFGQVL